MRNADIGASVSVYCGALFVLSAVVGHVERLDPNGEDGGSARLQSDFGRRGIFLRGAHSVGIGVVEHENVVVFIRVLRVFCVVRQGIFAIGDVVDVDIEIILVLIVEIEILDVFIVVLFLPPIVEIQLVLCGEIIPICLCLAFRVVSEPRRGSEIFPRFLGSIDNAAGRLRGGRGTARRRTGRLTPPGGRGNNQIPAVVVLKEFETAVRNARGIVFRGGDFGIVHAGILAVAACDKRRCGCCKHERR